MKCLLCPVEIDELKTFPSSIGPQGQKIEDVMGQWQHSQALAGWTHVALTAQKSAGSMSLLSGHICPAHPVKPGSVALTAASPETASAATDGSPSASSQKQAYKPNASETPKGKEPK
jgi:hypothetical protein